MNDRENDYQWAGPYLYSRQVIAVASDSGIQTFDDLLGKNVGVQDTTRAAELFFHTIDSALPEVKQVRQRKICLQHFAKDMSMRLQDMKLC